MDFKFFGPVCLEVIFLRVKTNFERLEDSLDSKDSKDGAKHSFLIV